MLRGHGVDVIRVVVADGAGQACRCRTRRWYRGRCAGSSRKSSSLRKSHLGTDLIVTAHSHARVSHDALKVAKHGGIGYHPSLLPRHRGIAAVEWTIKEGDPIAGGTIYHLSDRLDAGAHCDAGLVLRQKRRDRPRVVGKGPRTTRTSAARAGDRSCEGQRCICQPNHRTSSSRRMRRGSMRMLRMLHRSGRLHRIHNSLADYLPSPL